MVSKAAERKLINSSLSQSVKAIHLFFRTQFQLKLDHYEMKLHFPSSPFL